MQAVGVPCFTDQHRDAETGLDYFGARFYDSWIRRFDSQDPELIGPYAGVTFGRIAGDGQNFNAYSYVLNRPTIYVDRTGESATLVGPGVGLILGLGFEAGRQLKAQQFDPEALAESALIGLGIGLGVGLSIDLLAAAGVALPLLFLEGDVAGVAAFTAGEVLFGATVVSVGAGVVVETINEEADKAKEREEREREEKELRDRNSSQFLEPAIDPEPVPFPSRPLDPTGGLAGLAPIGSGINSIEIGGFPTTTGGGWEGW